MSLQLTRRALLHYASASTASLLLSPATCSRPPNQSTFPNFPQARDRCRDFMFRCARDDGGYNPSPDPEYRGQSDTRASDLAAVTYAATLARTMHWTLPHPERSIEFIRSHQRPDGSFQNLGGEFDPEDPLARLYNTTQGVVALRALGARPSIDPMGILDPFFEEGTFEELPLYTTSFFPLFYAAIDQPFPPNQKEAVRRFMQERQTEDGYLQDHVAASFHAAHFYRMIGEPTPKSEAMVRRTLEDQTAEGGWNIKEPDWDVHACFDAVFILRQLGGATPECRGAVERAALWVARCQNQDGGFGHFPGWPSDMDAVYFQFGTLIQAETVPGADYDLTDAHTLSWGHAMKPGKDYG